MLKIHVEYYYKKKCKTMGSSWDHAKKEDSGKDKGSFHGTLNGNYFLNFLKDWNQKIK